MPNVAEILEKAAEILRSKLIAEPRREAVSLLTFALEKDKTFLFAHPEYELSGAEEKRFSHYLERRARREPFQYITGRQEFYGLDFLVTPDVLIPRPETEIIVENALDILSEKGEARFCEIGTGSGCISVSILYNLTETKAVGADISEDALKIAKKNAEKHGVADRLELKISDVFERFENEKFDLIVSNPPYISSAEIANLQSEVRDFEPLQALTDGKDGFSIVEKIICDAPKYLKDGGFLLMEIGFGQAETVEKMFSPEIWSAVEILPDLQSIPRTIKAEKAKK